MMVMLLLLVFNSHLSVGLQENEVMCGHRLYFNNVSWYTAYETCNLNKKVLALPETDLSSLIILLDQILNKVFKFVECGRSNPGFWIGAIMRTSTNESMNFRCKLLHHRMNMSFSSAEDILCLYYDSSKRKVLADICNTSKPIICMNPIFEVSNCTMISSVSTLKKSGQYKLCQDVFPGNDTQECKNIFFNRLDSYAMSYDDRNDSVSKCVHYKYKKECGIGKKALGEEVTKLTHKS
nr:uncharacterized protein LOC117691916 [Crassostrea gigas]